MKKTIPPERFASLRNQPYNKNIKALMQEKNDRRQIILTDFSLLFS